MFGSSFSTFNSPTRVYVDNNMVSYSMDDFNPPYHSSYHDLPSPFIYNYNEIDIFGEPYFSPHDLSIIQQVTEEVTQKTMDFDKVEETINGIVEDGNNKGNEVTRPSVNHGSAKRRRSSKRDRHSKIRTAHGLRDRRMRLSLGVAYPFFKLQDMLGYDKGSSTVEWLLIQAKQAIEELLQSKNASPSGVTKCSTSNSTSNCEVESTMLVETKKGPTSSKGKMASTIGKENKAKQNRKRPTKESREEARARARTRTLEKKLKRMETLEVNKAIDDERLRSNCSSIKSFKMEGCSESNSCSIPNFSNSQSSDQISQSVPSYRISAQSNMMGDAHCYKDQRVQ